jgi:hypothetical protein
MQRIIPQEEWKAKQKDIQTREQEYRRKVAAGEKVEGPPPRDNTDPKTGKASRWLQCKTFSNYDETRWGPDPIDTVMDRLGIFEGLDFQLDIDHGEKNSFGPTTLIDRTGTPEYRSKDSGHYPTGMVNDAAQIGIDLDKFPMFDGSTLGPGCQAISNFIGLDYEQAQKGARREYGYDSFHMQRPGQVLMYHHDLYYAIVRDVDPELAWKPEKFRRFVIFMEDWKPGHVWIHGNTEYSHWKAGECITWNWQDMPHGTANLGFETRYSVHLTGYMTERSFDFYNKGHKDMRYVFNKETGSFDVYEMRDGARWLVKDY